MHHRLYLAVAIIVNLPSTTVVAFQKHTNASINVVCACPPRILRVLLCRALISICLQFSQSWVLLIQASHHLISPLASLVSAVHQWAYLLTPPMEVPSRWLNLVELSTLACVLPHTRICNVNLSKFACYNLRRLHLLYHPYNVLSTRRRSRCCILGLPKGASLKFLWTRHPRHKLHAKDSRVGGVCQVSYLAPRAFPRFCQGL